MGREDKLEVQPVSPGLGGGELTALGACLLWPGVGVDILWAHGQPWRPRYPSFCVAAMAQDLSRSSVPLVTCGVSLGIVWTAWLL